MSLELDKRIIEGKKPLTCFDLKEAEQFRGEDGYFTHEIEVFENLDRCYFSRLLGFDTCSESIPFAVANASRDYEFFLPAEWVKEPEKKYRPYSLNEFLNEHEIGDKITYRVKLDKQQEKFIRRKDMICGYQIETGKADVPGEGVINLGGMCVSLLAMFNNYETPNNYLYPEVWQPFGVVDKEE